MKKIVFLLLFSPQLFACIHLKYGTPLQSDQIICREGYAIGYNYSRRIADWVAYRLTPKIINGSADRQNDFRIDKSIPEHFQATPRDYEEPKYDLGHLVSSESQDLSTSLNSDTFLLSNIAPQLPGLNRAVWKGLENRERKWTNRLGELYVFVGMLFEGENVQYLNGKIAIPTHFFKIIYSQKTQQSISFLFPHKPIKTRNLDQYIVNIDEIEFRSGFNFLSKLDDQSEDRIERKTARKQW